MQAILGALLVPWDQLAAKPARVAKVPGGLLYDREVGVYPNKQAAMGAEFKKDVVDEFVYNISPPPTPFVEVKHVPRVLRSGLYSRGNPG